MMDFFDSAFDVVGDVFSGIGSAINDAIGNWIGKAFYYLIRALCELVRAIYSIFSVFAGITKINIDGDYQYLTNFFFENDMVSGIYWGMVMIGVALVFGFAIVSVIRKMFDLYDKQQQSLGQILSGCFKSILIMLCMTIIMSATMSLTNELVRRVNYIFDRNKDLTTANEIVFTDEQFATMARVLNTIGNYSLNPSYDQRYNLNACYNEIRPDLLILQEEGVFDLMYADPEGKQKETWQSALEELALAGDPAELMMDAYYEQVSKSLKDIMDTMRTDADFHPLESYQRQSTSSQAVSLDRILFLSGTMDAANNEIYNLNPSFNDAARGPFLNGDKDIYEIDDVTKVFNIRLGGISYLLILFVGFFMLKDLWRCIMNCTSRMINIVGLYIIAPPVAAAIPLDDGQKFREWRTAMVIQMLGIFGAIIPMRLVLLFIPMIMDSSFVLLPSVTANLFGKVALIVGLLEGVDRFGSVLTGILANSAGQEAIRASNLNDSADSDFNKYFASKLPIVGGLFRDGRSGGGSSGGGGRSGGGGGGSSSGGGNSGGGNGGGSSLPSRVPQGDSMNSMHGMGQPGTPLSGYDENGRRIGASDPSGSPYSATSGTGGLPGRVPSGTSMNSSSQSGGQPAGQSGTGGLPGKTTGGASMNASNQLGGKSSASGDLPGKASGGVSMSQSGGTSLNTGGTSLNSGSSSANSMMQSGGSFSNISGSGSLPGKASGSASMSSTMQPSNTSMNSSSSSQHGGSSANISGSGGDTPGASAYEAGNDSFGGSDLPENAGIYAGYDGSETAQFGGNDSFGGGDAGGSDFSFAGGDSDASFGGSGFDLPANASGFADSGSDFLDGSASDEFGGGFDAAGGFDLPANASGFADSGSDFLDGSASDEFGGDFGGSDLPGNASGFVEHGESMGDFGGSGGDFGGMNNTFSPELPGNMGGDFGGMNQTFTPDMPAFMPDIPTPHVDVPTPHVDVPTPSAQPGNNPSAAGNPMQEQSFSGLSQSFSQSHGGQGNASGKSESEGRGRSNSLPPKRTAPPPRKPRKKE